MRIHDAYPHPHQRPHVRLFKDEGQPSEDDQGNKDIPHVLTASSEFCFVIKARKNPLSAVRRPLYPGRLSFLENIDGQMGKVLRIMMTGASSQLRLSLENVPPLH